MVKDFDGKSGVFKVNLDGAGDSLNKQEEWMILEMLKAIQRQLTSIEGRMNARWPQEEKKETKKSPKKEIGKGK